MLKKATLYGVGLTLTFCLAQLINGNTINLMNFLGILTGGFITTVFIYLVLRFQKPKNE
ncbi:hypothetical protein [Salicibibacter halophilus]|uniref:hypothetical protein n=1 Tax=Salicibibacter halophilus TaxID=2502791 RepID=UPI00135BC58C|nr:hypothetical protein [Salicibibacter halophilus]